MKKIQITTEKFAIIDDDDYDFISSFKWRLIKGNYAQTGKSVYMHRLINRTPDGMDTDHINGDRLDNRKQNLRSCTRSQNRMNQHVVKAGNKYKGVYFCKFRKKFVSDIRINGKTMHLGRFKTDEEAAIEYNKAAVKYFGEFANLNII